MKVTFYSICFNNPDYIEYQKRCLDKHCQDKEWELVAIINASDGNMRQALEQRCRQVGITYHINPQPDHSLAGLSHISAINWAWQAIISKQEGYIGIFDHDMFAIKDFLVDIILNDYVFNSVQKEYVLAGINQSKESEGRRVEYFHPGLFFADMTQMQNKEMLNFDGGYVDEVKVDVGGQTAMYIRDNNPTVKWLQCHAVKSEHRDLLEQSMIDYYDEEYHSEIIANTFFHVRIGSNWIAISPEKWQQRNELMMATLKKYL